jgi:prepilin-type N-terminal cleavage/methylation domain-containing protein
MKKKGFTLLEVLIVVIIIGVLAAISLPQYVNTIEKARSAEALSILGTLRSSMERHYFEDLAMGEDNDTSFNAGATGSIMLDIDNPNDSSELWLYGVDDDNDPASETKDYLVGAVRTGKTDYWVTIDEGGSVTKSQALGGTGVTFPIDTEEE